MQAIVVAQIIIPIIVTALVLIQDRSSGVGGLFGGGESFYQKRRGMENIVLWITAAFIVLFVILSILKLVL
ncbi:MAG: preprotein translocase subunit SecG [Parcubacteria group bacterium]